MLSSLTLNDATGTAVTIHSVTPTSKRALVTAKGLTGIAPLRQTIRVRPSAHGALNETKFEQGCSITLEGEITGTTAPEVMSEFRAVTKPMLETLDFGPALMKWEEQEGLKLQAAVKLDSEIEPV